MGGGGGFLSEAQHMNLDTSIEYCSIEMLYQACTQEGACAPPFNLMIFHNHCWCICSYPISLKMQLSSLLDVG